MAVSEAVYIEMMKSCSKFNTRITSERKTRYPSIDQQTGIAHRPSVWAWRKPEHRMKSSNPEYVYEYPPVKWRRDPNAPPSDATEMKMFLHNNEPLNNAINQTTQGYGGAPMAPMMAPMGNLEAMAMMSSGESTLDSSLSHSMNHSMGGAGEGRRAATLKREAYDYDDDPEDSLDDFKDDSDEEFGAKKKKGKGGGASAKKKKASGGAGAQGAQQSGASAVSSTPANAIPAEEKRHACNKCGARYKSRPGLSYHKAHVHGDGVQAPANVLAGGDGTPGTPSRGRGRAPAPPPIDMPRGSGGGGACPSPAILPPPPIFSPSVDVSDTCDFCDGTKFVNNKTKQPEDLVTCHDCGRSAHPSCLSFTDNMKLSASKFGWQCIECKSCAICGTSDNDDKLLFCDDCDRGFHLYCLSPPLDKLPDDAWSCHLCMKVFGSKAAARQPKK